MAKTKTTAYKAPRITWRRDFKRNWPVYMMFLPAIIFMVVLHYIPMFGIVMAFQDFNVTKGYFGSEWVGLKNFIDLFTGDQFLVALRNTVCIAVIKTTLGFVPPIIFAFLLSMIQNKKFKRFCQTMSYLPNFVAAVVVVSLVQEFLAKDGPLT